MIFLELNFILGLFMISITNLIPRKKKTEREEKENELETKRSCEELEEQLSYFCNRPNLANDLGLLLKCEWKKQIVGFFIMQIPVLNIIFFVNMILDRIKEFKGDK